MVSPTNGCLGPDFPLLVGQRSSNDLSLDKFETPIGNVVEEDCHFMQNPSLSSSSSSSLSPAIVLENIGSSYKRNVEQVWDEIFHQGHDNVASGMCFQQQLVPGENTFEEYLVRTGDQSSVVISNPQPLMAIDPLTMSDSNFKVPELGYLDNQLGFPMLPLQAERKRCCGSTNDEMLEKTVERKQRRIIKNRESAARSRARKQAYTDMLEQQVSELRIRNNCLKKLKEAETVLNLDLPPVPRYQLRRTTSSTF